MSIVIKPKVPVRSLGGESARNAIEPICVNVNDAAMMLGISVRLLHSLVSRGEIQPTRAGRRLLFPVKRLREFALGEQGEPITAAAE